MADNQQKVVDNWKSVKVQVRYCMSIGYTWLITSRKLAKSRGFNLLLLLYKKEDKMSYQLTEGNKTRLREKIVQGAKNYDKYLNNKCFKIICEDGIHTEVRFFQDDFKHLTGIESDLNESDFYAKCCKDLISTGNILTNQSYDWSTLRGKSNRIASIHELLYKDAKKTLLINGLITHTYVFPVAIRNDEINSCVGFVSNINKARSLRKAGTSKNTQTEKTIIAILGRKNGNSIYDEIVYMKDKGEVLSVYPSILGEISVKI